MTKKRIQCYTAKYTTQVSIYEQHMNNDKMNVTEKNIPVVTLLCQTKLEAKGQMLLFGSDIVSQSFKASRACLLLRGTETNDGKKSAPYTKLVANPQFRQQSCSLPLQNGLLGFRFSEIALFKCYFASV